MGQAVFDQLSLELGSTGTKRRPDGPQPKARDFPLVGRPRLTLGEAARIIREAVKDKRYRSTPLGQLVGRYLRWFRNEYGATESTLRDYEAVLARMSLTLADKDPIDVSVDDLRDVIDLWGERSPRTRQKVTSVVRAFWSWAEEQGHIAISPAARIRRPRAEKRIAPLLPADARPRLLTIAKHPRDRLALFCLLLLGVRRGELAGIQIRDFDAQRCSLRVYGKGRKERILPLRGPVLAELRLFLSTDLPHVRRPPEPDDFRRPSIAGGTANCRTQASSAAALPTASTCTWPATPSPRSSAASPGSTPRHKLSATPISTRRSASTAIAIKPTSRPRWTPMRSGWNSNGRTQAFLPKLTAESARLSQKVEAAGIEPASADAPVRTSTSVVRP